MLGCYLRGRFEMCLFKIVFSFGGMYKIWGVEIRSLGNYENGLSKKVMSKFY